MRMQLYMVDVNNTVLWTVYSSSLRHAAPLKLKHGLVRFSLQTDCTAPSPSKSQMTILVQSSLYSTHAARPRKRPTSTSLMRAINKVMKAELGANAIARWHEQLDEAIGETVFAKSVDADSTLALPAPKIWCPTRPTLTRSSPCLRRKGRCCR